MPHSDSGWPLSNGVAYTFVPPSSNDELDLMQMEPARTPPRLRLCELKSPLAGPYDFTLEAGACAVIAGPSGSGKSLFLRMIADLDPNEGVVWQDDRPRRSLRASDWRRAAPYVAADAGWWLDEVEAHFAPEHRDAGRDLALRLGLTDGQFDGAVARLSTGERQRLAIIRALVLSSPVLLLDEPTSALDPMAIDLVEGVLKERLAAGTSVLMVSHDEQQAVRLQATRYEMVERKLTRLA
jgi:ABC-type iron transport system FetAB ATPase subunit